MGQVITFTQPRSNGIVSTDDLLALLLDAFSLRLYQLKVLLRQADEGAVLGTYQYSDREFEDVFGGVYPASSSTTTRRPSSPPSATPA